MTKYLPWLFIMIILLVILFSIDMISRCREIETQMQIERYYNEQKYDELAKEIRILKQDIYVLQSGYEGTEK